VYDKLFFLFLFLHPQCNGRKRRCKNIEDFSAWRIQKKILSKIDIFIEAYVEYTWKSIEHIFKSNWMNDKRRKKNDEERTLTTAPSCAQFSVKMWDMKNFSFFVVTWQLKSSKVYFIWTELSSTHHYGISSRIFFVPHSFYLQFFRGAAREGFMILLTIEIFMEYFEPPLKLKFSAKNISSYTPAVFIGRWMKIT